MFCMDTVVQGKSADKNQAPCHQQVANKENDYDKLLACAEHPEPNQAHPCRPQFAGRNWWHHLGARLVHQFADGNDL